MKNPDVPRKLRYLLLCAAAYLLSDLPIQLTGFLHFGSWIGIKCFLPVTLGLFFGPWGVAGGMLGCIAAAGILHTPLMEAALECTCIVVLGMGMWLLWYPCSGGCKVGFKQVRHILIYAGLLLGLSLLCGWVSLPFLQGVCWPTVAAYTALGLLVGLPVNIILGSLFSLEPVLPPYCTPEKDVSGWIDADPVSLEHMNEQLEDSACLRRIPRKRIFEVQSCIEEVVIRVLNAVPDARILLCVDFGDAFSIRFTYAGAKYNPLRTGRDEDAVDVMSLKLIKHRAMRAMYSYQSGENHLHIVI